jgi:hypothetical protein
LHHLLRRAIWGREMLRIIARCSPELVDKSRAPKTKWPRLVPGNGSGQY